MKVKVAAVQAAPVFFDLEKTLYKAEQLIAESADAGAELVVFPESFISGYPRGFSFEAVVGKRTDAGRDLYFKYHQSSLEIPSKEFFRLEMMSKKYNVYLMMGVTERDSISGSLYCTMVYFSPKSGYMGKHRKLKPTGVERLVWGEGDGKTLSTFDTPIGKLGGLICWENYMPLARMAMYQKGVQIYLAPTADERDTWVATMQHIACEGRCFVIGVNQFFEHKDYDEAYAPYISMMDNEFVSRGASVIVSPLGEILAGPLIGKAGILTAELDMDEIVKSKLGFDSIGHYAREDVFQLLINGIPDTKIID
jgi:nitrilase